jgi:CubicO group peptidase (beta-lactamase class C family)
MSHTTRLQLLAAGLGALALGYGTHHLTGLLSLAAAHKAKVLCSGVFVSGRDPADILAQDLAGVPSWIAFGVDREGQAVDAWFGGAARQRAVYRPGLGCTLLAGVPERELRTRGEHPNPGSEAAGSAPTPGGLPPWGDDLPPGVSRKRTEAVVAAAFEEPDPSRPRRTRAVVVVHRGRVLAERYAPGIGPETPLPGWSMAKSVTGAVVGVLVGRGTLDLHAPAPVPEWKGDARAGITLHHLLTMTCGLRFDDRSGPVLSDLNRMLLLAPDAAAYAADKPLEHPPGSRWQYSGAPTNILSRIVRQAIGGSLEDYWRFPREALFDRIGMNGAVWEPDASGTLVGSSYLYATARDWARFGLLHLRDGRWGTQQVLPAGWVRYATTPAPAAPGREYGAHLWLYWDDPAGEDPPEAADTPSAFFASGYEGQYLVAIPGRDLVVVRLGQTADPRAWDMAAFVRDLLAALVPEDSVPAAPRSKAPHP